MDFQLLWMIGLATLAMSCCVIADPDGGNDEKEEEKREEAGWYQSVFNSARQRGLPEDGLLLVVTISGQRMMLLQGGKAVRAYTVSTSKSGLGNRVNSNRTPRGLHRVARRIGSAAPLGQRFVGRRATSEVVPPAKWRQADGEDMVLTRILRLEGLEPGVNKGKGIDSFDRFIYIHGTNQEQLLGRPASHGCIRMGNRDVKELFERTRGNETWCWISPNVRAGD